MRMTNEIYKAVSDELEIVMERVLVNKENKTKSDCDRINAEYEAICVSHGVTLLDWEKELDHRLGATQDLATLYISSTYVS